MALRDATGTAQAVHPQHNSAGAALFGDGSKGIPTAQDPRQESAPGGTSQSPKRTQALGGPRRAPQRIPSWVRSAPRPPAPRGCAATWWPSGAVRLAWRCCSAASKEASRDELLSIIPLNTLQKGKQVSVYPRVHT